MKLGLIGTRHVHASGLVTELRRQGAEIIGASEHDPDARSAWSLTPLLDEDVLVDAADALVVAGTNRERVDGMVAATRAGTPVLVEKPVATSGEELVRIQGEVDPHLVMVALPLRFSAAMQRAREVVRSGAIGTVLAARGTNHGQFPGGWFGVFDDAGGGALQDHVVHLADGLCWLLDDHATQVYAATTTGMDLGIDVEDCGIVTIDFAGGAFASIDSSWSRPRSFPTWGDVWLEMVGTRGRLHVDPMAARLDHFSDAAGKLLHRGYSLDDMNAAMIGAFMRFAENPGREPSPVTLAEGSHASEIVLAAYESAERAQVAQVRAPGQEAARRSRW